MTSRVITSTRRYPYRKHSGGGGRVLGGGEVGYRVVKGAVAVVNLVSKVLVATVVKLVVSPVISRWYAGADYNRS